MSTKPSQTHVARKPRSRSLWNRSLKNRQCSHTALPDGLLFVISGDVSLNTLRERIKKIRRESPVLALTCSGPNLRSARGRVVWGRHRGVAVGHAGGGTVPGHRGRHPVRPPQECAAVTLLRRRRALDRMQCVAGLSPPRPVVSCRRAGREKLVRESLWRRGQAFSRSRGAGRGTL